MEKLTELLAAAPQTGGYTAYVWPSFIFAAAVMIGVVILTLRSLRRVQKMLAELPSSPPREIL